ncbi:hypothetical protein CROQUDRAFT_61327 [Cronartium quercuum f. sp. fusiforme G11]|uniref:FAD-binding FR-type domain-containing protein n=1 Tax=Cronartium quercuum f. sp. fusiforme G11 TaxID=708437 RepID=A0A9P6NKN7_9BASI|nr:hypothetical protein CROQUDRAFT_61327 [Cronartium quercuum f. sp. fusiforme G11]
MGCLAFIKREFTGRRLVFNVIWHGIHFALFAFGWIAQKSNQKLAILNLLQYSVWTSRGAGLCLAFDGAVMFLPLCRKTIAFLRPSFRGLMPLDENIWFHRQAAYTCIFYSFIHVTAHYVNMLNVERTQVRPNTAVGIMYTETGPFTGHVMVFILVIMATTAHHSIRKQCFEAFWYTHQLAIFWAIAFYSHASGCFVRGAMPGEKVHCIGFNSITYAVYGGVIYCLERVWREISSRRQTEVLGVLLHPSGTMDIRFRKPSFKYVPGQWIYLQMPEVSNWQWHPFTISSAPDDPYISIHVRQVGDFTRAVGRRLGATPKLVAQISKVANQGIKGKNARNGRSVDITTVKSPKLPVIRIDGPYGAPAEDVFNFEFVILIGAGIGVTPFASILKNIYYMQKKGNLNILRKVQFIWLNKHAAAVGWFQELLQNLEESIQSSDLLQIDMYLTGVLDIDTAQNVALNDVGAEYDALTGLKSRTHFGRPVWDKDVFLPAGQLINSGHHAGLQPKTKRKVGVFYCGPSDLARTLKSECKKHSTNTYTFEFYKEHF